jgi:hypothetical protein
MDKKYWVIGGEYDAKFDHLLDGTQRIAGPFSNELRARTEWQRLTFHDGCCATERYHIAVEPRA